ncbi:MAG: hypothetical protein Q4A84_04290 [Neisseria sp.]|uniref:hypothetical protein n=1 Tax=Neisseria sp. TaxID=192066 RepID=UPI0026DCC987|nr:hypothetical protein [Neisseria sp.]MDO4640910.1 hypothetical protein [Neisseria sp.]
MKWLFAILVALNIIVFGAVVGIHVSKKTSEAGGKETVAVEGTQELKVPNTVLVQTKDDTPPAWVKSGNKADTKEPAAVALRASEEKTAVQKEAEEKARLEHEKKLKVEKLKKEAEEKARKANEAGLADRGVAPNAVQNTQGEHCNRFASVTMPEDDYHRIKGLLVQWPHAATRRVEQREAASNEKRNVKYAVWLPAQGDTQALLDELSAKGFNGSSGSGGVVAGAFTDPNAAQALFSRLQGAGFSVQIREQGGNASGGASVAKMQVLFSSLSESDMQAVQNVVGKYGKLQRGNCK